jgi:signal transduction histidine kinase
MATLERMRELDNMKSAFLANMSHELRTPLNSILGFTQVILEELDGPVTEIMASDLDVIEKNGRHLLGLITEILDMSKIEAGRLSLSIEPVDLRQALVEALGTSASLARDRHLVLSLAADQSEDWRVDADEVRVRQIFYNLLGNAVKFTECGSVQVSLHKVNLRSADRPDGVQVRVQDTGIGIPRHKLEEIFEAFTQVDTSTTRKAGGAGLGLPISRRLAAMHSGRLWAESDGLGCGATFVLELPIEQEVG